MYHLSPFGGIDLYPTTGSCSQTIWHRDFPICVAALMLSVPCVQHLGCTVLALSAVGFRSRVGPCRLQPSPQRLASMTFQLSPARDSAIPRFGICKKDGSEIPDETLPTLTALPPWRRYFISSRLYAVLFIPKRELKP